MIIINQSTPVNTLVWSYSILSHRIAREQRLNSIENNSWPLLIAKDTCFEKTHLRVREAQQEPIQKQPFASQSRQEIQIMLHLFATCSARLLLGRVYIQYYISSYLNLPLYPFLFQIVWGDPKRIQRTWVPRWNVETIKTMQYFLACSC